MKIVNHCFKTSSIKPMAIDYVLMLIKDELNTITTIFPNKYKGICQNNIIDQIATICGIEQSNQRLLLLDKLEKLFKCWLNNWSIKTGHENYLYDNKTNIATILLLKTIIFYLKCNNIYIIK